MIRANSREYCGLSGPSEVPMLLWVGFFGTCDGTQKLHIEGFFVGVLVMRVLLFAIYVRAPDIFLTLPCKVIALLTSLSTVELIRTTTLGLLHDFHLELPVTKNHLEFQDF